MQLFSVLPLKRLIMFVFPRFPTPTSFITMSVDVIFPLLHKYVLSPVGEYVAINE